MTRNERRCIVSGLIVVVPETERVNMEFDRKELLTLIAATCVYGWRLERGDDRSDRATERLMRANALCRRFHEALNRMDDHRRIGMICLARAHHGAELNFRSARSSR